MGLGRMQSTVIHIRYILGNRNAVRRPLKQERYMAHYGHGMRPE